MKVLLVSVHEVTSRDIAMIEAATTGASPISEPVVNDHEDERATGDPWYDHGGEG